MEDCDRQVLGVRILGGQYKALGQDEPIVLIDSHGNEIMDCEGTRGTD